jgi:hypothetical protein
MISGRPYLVNNPQPARLNFEDRRPRNVLGNINELYSKEIHAVRKRYSEKLKASLWESNRQRKENIDNRMRTMGSAANNPIDLDDLNKVGYTYVLSVY